MENIGGYDESAFIDHLSCHFLALKLLETGYVMPYLAMQDKGPNLDGYIELLEDYKNVEANLPSNLSKKPIKKVPFGRIEVQVKGLPKGGYLNHNSHGVKSEYKYSCETKAINAVLKGVTANAVALCLVDYDQKVVFFIPLTLEYCASLDVGSQTHKTIYFDNEDRLFFDNTCMEQLRCVYEYHQKELHDSGTYLISPGLPQSQREQVKDAYEYLNDLMRNQLSFIKQAFFPDIWKFGIAYLEDEEPVRISIRRLLATANAAVDTQNEVDRSEKEEEMQITSSGSRAVGIFFIKKTEDGNFLRVFDYNEQYPASCFYGPGYSLDGAIRDLLKGYVENFFKRDNLICQVQFLPNVALEEIVSGVLNHIVSHDAMSKAKDGDVVTFGLPSEPIIIDDDLRERIFEFESELERQEALLCVDELEKRGIKQFTPPWRHVNTYKVAQEEKGVLNFDSDRDSLNNENMKRWLEGIEDFYYDTLNQFGENPVLKCNRKLKIRFSENFSNFIVLSRSCNRFAFSWSQQDGDLSEVYKDFRSQVTVDKQSTFTWGKFFNNDYSWYKLWRVYCRTQVLKYLDPKGESNRGFSEYMAEL